jgi:hypothetical protein
MQQLHRSSGIASFGPAIGLGLKTGQIDVAEKRGMESPWSCSTAAPSPDITPLFDYDVASPNPNKDLTGSFFSNDFGKSAEFALPDALDTAETKTIRAPPGFKASGGPSSQLLFGLAGYGNRAPFLALAGEGQGPAYVVPRCSQTETSVFGSAFKILDGQIPSPAESQVPMTSIEEKREVTQPSIGLPPGLEDVIFSQETPPEMEEELPIPPGTVTIMIRNLPNKYSRELLQARLNEQFLGKYDFLYLPVDFKNRCNMGYAFVNFRKPADCVECCKVFHGRAVQDCLPGFNSAKVCAVSPARVQGCIENVRRLRSSPVMAQLMSNKQWLPQLFNKDGQPIAFPEPDQPLPAWENAANSGKSRGKGRTSQTMRRA